MHCPACNADNPSDAGACSACQAPLSPSRKRRRAAEADSPRTEELNRQVRGVLRLCYWSVVPFLGLALGPLGAFMAWRLIRRSRRDPAFTALRGAQAALVIGGLCGLFNAAGVALMALGLWLG